MAASDAARPLADAELRATLLRGLVIPAHPLALTAERRLDERRQVALDALLLRCGRGRRGRRRPHHAVRDPGGRPARARAAARRAGGRGPRGPGRPPAAEDRRRRGKDGAGGRRGDARARPRLRRGAAEPGRAAARRTTPRSSRTAGAWPRCCRCSASTCSRRSAAACSATASGARCSSVERVVAIKVAPFSRYHTLEVVACAGRERPRRERWRSTPATTTRSSPTC